MPSSTHRNYFTVLRIFLASLVVVSHSFSITGQYEDDILYALTHKMDLGSFAVKCFFAISGYLVFQSTMHSQDFMQYCSKRILRLYPALVVCSIVMMLVAAIVYDPKQNLPVWKLPTWRNIPLDVLSLFHDKITVPDVFSAHPSLELNAPLWTLPYEFLCYSMLGVLSFLIPKSNLTAVLAAVVCGIAGILLYDYGFLNSFFGVFYLKSQYVYDMSLYFFVGAWLACSGIMSSLPHKKTLIYLSAFAFGISFLWQPLVMVRYFALPFFVIALGNSPLPKSFRSLTALPDISYGIYIYGFLVQQSLYAICQPSPWVLTMLALPLTAIVAWLSWVFVEKPALSLKKSL